MIIGEEGVSSFLIVASCLYVYTTHAARLFIVYTIVRGERSCSLSSAKINHTRGYNNAFHVL
jgi:hypothetical protein